MVADGNNKGIGGVSSRGWGQGSNGKNLWVVDDPEEHEVLCLTQWEVEEAEDRQVRKGVGRGIEKASN